MKPNANPDSWRHNNVSRSHQHHMRPIFRPIVFLAAAANLLLAASSAVAEGTPSTLFAPPAVPVFEVTSTEPLGGGTLTAVRLESQTWQDIKWQHWLRLVEPAKLRHPDACVLVIGGGRNRAEAPRRLSGPALALPMIAQELGTYVAYLEQVPNQPLFGNLREDALIAYSFEKFLETRDESWPALVPMVKSARAAMDTIQALSAKRGTPVKRFYVTGASKRGWTTWLTAVHDERVAAIAPMVIDVLNMREQMPHQVATFGDYSDEISDYANAGLAQKIASPEAKRLVEIVDPYASREKLGLPKLIVLGTNDPYWPADAVNLYFDGLPGEKYIHYVPNAGHGLDPTVAIATATFFRQVLDGEARPRFTFTHEPAADGSLATVVKAETAPLRAEVWSASAATRDFRKALWTSATLEVREGTLRAAMAAPERGFAASYVALVYRDAKGYELKLCTPIKIVGRPPAAKRELF